MPKLLAALFLAALACACTSSENGSLADTGPPDAASTAPDAELDASADTGAEDARADATTSDAEPIDTGPPDSGTEPADSGAEPADSGPAPSRFLDTRDGIHTFLTFEDDILPADRAAAAAHSDFIWGVEPYNMADYRVAHPEMVLSLYVPFSRDPDATRDLAWWTANHPEWIAYKCDRTPVYFDPELNVPIDISNPDLIAWQVENIARPAAAAGFDAIAFDNFFLYNALGVCGVYRNGVWTQLYDGTPADPQWRADALAWLVAMKSALSAMSPPLLLIPNFDLGHLGATDPLLIQVLDNSDAVLDEGGFTKGGRERLSNTEWLDRVALMEEAQRRGKAFFLINEFPTVDRDAVEWALSSYLMGKEQAAYIFNSEIQQYGGDEYRPEYAAAIGRDCGPMQAIGSAYKRSFTHALAITNPTTHNVTTALTTDFVDLDGATVTSPLTLAPRTGRLLIATSTTCP